MLEATYDIDQGYRPLQGPEKVAALLLVMGKPLASKLLVHFDAAELKLITRSAAELGSVPIDVLEELVEEFAGDFSKELELHGTADQAEGLLAGALPPDQVADIMSDVLGSSNKTIWQKIAAVTPRLLTDYLLMQHPQVIALALSKVDAGAAAEVMALMPRPVRNETMRRLLSLRPVSDPPIRLIEVRLHDELIVNPPRPAGASASKMADIINKMAPEHMHELLESLEQDRPEEAEFLRSKLFSFDDLVKLPQKTRQVLFEKVPSERIVLALIGTDEEFCANVLSSLTARARRLVENEMSNAGSAAQKDIAAARRAIVGMLLEMAEAGEVELRADDDLD
ncbi:flagellar motor switch protein FliG [Beijerinckia sp. L45]|uniref:flagellar motor switch protein FliG n=1 Tax=Beijerinckia sp. L45 TaxID=1641855 RepID=UPI00131C5716|nr:FliG C-terminal domain-containing protein [Beijerinckia sp. L45]